MKEPSIIVIVPVTPLLGEFLGNDAEDHVAPVTATEPISRFYYLLSASLTFALTESAQSGEYFLLSSGEEFSPVATRGPYANGGKQSFAQVVHCPTPSCSVGTHCGAGCASGVIFFLVERKMHSGLHHSRERVAEELCLCLFDPQMVLSHTELIFMPGMDISAPRGTGMLFIPCLSHIPRLRLGVAFVPVPYKVRRIQVHWALEQDAAVYTNEMSLHRLE